MVYFFEMGNQFTVDFGDIDESFYNSLESMFDKIIDMLRNQPANIQDKYLLRLQDAVSSANSIGWGYYDYLCDILIPFEEEIGK